MLSRGLRRSQAVASRCRPEWRPPLAERPTPWEVAAGAGAGAAPFSSTRPSPQYPYPGNSVRGWLGEITEKEKAPPPQTNQQDKSLEETLVAKLVDNPLLDGFLDDSDNRA